MIDHTPLGQLKDFWDKEGMPYILSILDGRYRVPEIQTYATHLLGEVQARYSFQLQVTLSTTNSKDRAGKNIVLPFGASASQGRPTITFFVPAVRTLFRELRQKKLEGFRGRFERMLVTGFCHELDHLSRGMLERPTASQFVDDERIANAATCQNVMRVFVEVCGEELDKADMKVYAKWVACGRNAESQQWRDFIASTYGTISRGAWFASS